MQIPKNCHPDLVAVFEIPADVTHWTCTRFAPGEDLKSAGERLTHDAGDGVTVREWPIGDLSVDALRERWGAGIYRIGWLRLQGGKRAHKGRSRAVEVGEPAAGVVAAPRVAAAVPAVLGTTDPLGMMRELRALAREEQEILDRGVEGRIHAVTQLATVFLGARPAPGPDPQIAAALQGIGQAMQGIAATLTTLTARVDALEVSEDEDDEEEEEEDEDDEGDEDDKPEPDAVDKAIAKVERLAPIALGVVAAMNERSERQKAQASAPPPPPPSTQPALPEARREPEGSTFGAMVAAERGA